MYTQKNGAKRNYFNAILGQKREKKPPRETRPRRVRELLHRVGDKLEKHSSTFVMLAVASAVLLAIVGFACFSIAILPDRSGITRVTVPDFTGQIFSGLDPDDGLFELAAEYRLDNELPEGTVISQNPSAGAHRMVKKGERLCRVELVVSRRGKTLILPDLVGESAESAKERLAGLGLSVEVLERNSDREIGVVVSSYPKAFSDIPEGSKVKIWISTGVEKRSVTVPALAGLSESLAIARLRELGFEVGETEYIKSDKPVGTVVSQSAPFGAEVSEGSRIYLTVSVGNN